MRGSTKLDNYEYDNFLAKKGKYKEVRDRSNQRKNVGYEGWHWGLGDQPVKCNSKEDFKKELGSRNLVMRDDVKRVLK